MKPILLSILILISSLCGAQDSTIKLSFKEIGWTINLPHEFKILDSDTIGKMNKQGAKLFNETSGKTIDFSQTINLLSANKTASDFINVTLQPFDIEGPLNYDSICKDERVLLYKTYAGRLPDNAGIDTAISIQTIDGLTFDTFTLKIILNGTCIATNVILNKYYKGFDIGVAYLYVDEKTGRQIQDMLSKSTFIK